MGLASNASAAGLELVGLGMSDRYMVTLKVGSLVDLKSMMDNAGFDESKDSTSFEHQLTKAGLDFTYSGSWTHSPLIPSGTSAPGGISSLTQQASADEKHFSLDFSYNSPPKLVDGTELVTFAIEPPPGAWGKIELTNLKLYPFTIEIDHLGSDHESLASVTVSHVPEPSTYLMMVIGLAAFGSARRSRNR
jgi:hypothetical protein